MPQNPSICIPLFVDKPLIVAYFVLSTLLPYFTVVLRHYTALGVGHMESPPPAVSHLPFQNRWLRIGLISICLLLLIIGWQLTPAGILGKADAIGYAVCHRIDTRSFHLGEREMPLCARCTGTFLAAIVGAAFLFAIGRGRSASWPPTWMAGILVFSIIPWGLDGLNSYLTFFPQLPHLYEPQNWLRLTTGTFLGLAVSALFLPAINQSLWKNPNPVPVLANAREFFAYFFLGPLIILAITTENPIVLYPLAILSAFGVLYLLMGVYSAGVLMLLRKEGQFSHWHEAWPILLAGILLAFIQIGLIDFARFALTNTWGGFSLGR
jgi:uncharacterized membrane protein